MSTEFTAEGVRANLCAVERVRNNINSAYKTLPEDWHDWALEQVAELTCAVNFRNDLTAYADTLSKPADSGRVDAKAVERAVMADSDRPCLYGVAGPCQHPNCLESHFDTLRATLAAQGQGEPVAKVRHFDYRGIARNGCSQEAEMLDAAPVLPDGTLLYTRPAPPASPAGVPDGWRETILSVLSALDAATGDSDPNIDADLTDDEVRDEYPEVWAMQQLSAMLAAPSAPEGDGGGE